jgi:hypothetical protein
MDERVGLLTVDFAANTSNINVDDIGHGIEMEIPYVLQQHRAWNHLTFVANQIFEELEFSWQQFDFSPGAARRSRHEVEVEVTHAQHRFFDDGIAASGESVDPGQQFREGERLDQVIIAAGAQAAHPIVDLAQRTDDQGGCNDPIFPQTPDNRDSINARKHAIDRHHGIFGRTSAAQSVVAVDSEIDLIAARRQRIYELLGGLAVVFNDENAALRCCHDFCVSNPTPEGIRSDHLVIKVGNPKLTFLSETVALVI